MQLTDILSSAVKMKKVMKKRGIRRAKAECPHCKRGLLHAMLEGRKEHLYMYCDNSDCGVRFIE